MNEKLLEYTDLLHRHQDPEAREVREFLRKHESDKVFQERVRKLNALFLLKASTPQSTPAPQS